MHGLWPVTEVEESLGQFEVVERTRVLFERRLAPPVAVKKIAPLFFDHFFQLAREYSR